MTEQAARPARRIRAPLYGALVTSALLGLLALAAWMRGGMADTAPRDPEHVADGVVCQVLDRGEGRRPARCAMVIAAPVAEVSAAVRDYEHFGETFDSILGRIELTTIEHLDDATVHLEGRVSTVMFGAWPIDVRVHHEDRADGGRTARWEESEGTGEINRGQWVISPVPEGSLVVYELEIQTRWAPTFLVNDVLLTQIPYPLRRVRERVSGAG